MKKFKLRFNLSRGENYMKWKVNFPDGTIAYYSPETYSFVMYGCVLKNNRKTAEKIYSGENKSVCAWIVCDDLHLVFPANNTIDYNNKKIKYNPKIKPYWLNEAGENLDNNYFAVLLTLGKKIFIA